MRTPLNAIIGCCDLANRSCIANDMDKTKDYLKKISYAGNQLINIINDILELSRVEAGKDNLEQRKFDLRELLIDHMKLFSDKIAEDGKKLEVNINFENDIVISDDNKISQIINNLLSNAIKYTNPGATIRIEAKQFNFQPHSKYQIVVEDTGIGMTPEFLNHIFDPYSRETLFTSHNVVGTGLGMPIVKSLVQQMNGEISVESELGKGTKFVVTLPMKIIEDESHDPVYAPEVINEPFKWDGRRILVAEDNELNMEIFIAVLNQFGAQVLSAVDGIEAVNIFEAEPPYSIDAILMDLHMPRMDGCEAATTIRKLNRADALDIPIIAVTANAFVEDIDRTTAAGMNAHVSKPIDSKVLRSTIEKLVLDRKMQKHED